MNIDKEIQEVLAIMYSLECDLSELKASHSDKVWEAIKQLESIHDYLNRNSLKFNFDGFTEREISSIHDWFEYKVQKKQSYKTKQSLNALRNKLLAMKATNDITKCIENSMSNNWSGIFETNKIKQNNISGLFNTISTFSNNESGEILI
jgi:hypothetical protein